MLYHVLKLHTDSSTSIEDIRGKGEVIEAATHEAAVEAWINEADADPHRDCELAVLDADGRHKMFTVFPKVTLDWRLSRYQGLS